MKGPYKAEADGTITYCGNKIFKRLDNICLKQVPDHEFIGRVNQFRDDEMWKHIARINHQIFMSACTFFSRQGALFTALPLTTRMISSPGAVYGKNAIDYTTDTCPITLDWFNLPKKAFLSESSQIYLELALLQQDVDKVFSIYNSFRKEEADATHLSEFHHIEFEGQISQEENIRIALELTKHIVADLLHNNIDDVRFFLNSSAVSELHYLAEHIHEIPQITFAQAMKKLGDATGNLKYRKLSLENFGSWEEVKLTELFQNMVIIREFPLLEVPFYHAVKEESSPAVALNADFIWPGYREFIGSGLRVRTHQELKEKAKIFNLPEEDYAPYLQSRIHEEYRPSSGFGLGWERLLHGLLQLPFIWTAAQFPRVHTGLRP